MAAFCTKCGSGLGDEVRFCLRCGAAVASPPAPPQEPLPVAPAGVRATGAAFGLAPAESGSAVLKIIAGVLAVSTLVTLLSIGSCAYFDYRARKRAMELPQPRHYDRPGGETSGRRVDAREVCSLVTNEEVGQALGTTVSSANSGTSGCRYTSSVGRSLTVEVTRQGGSLALRLSAMALKGAMGRAGAVRPVAGIGDEAYAGRKGSTLMFRKGDVLVNLEVHMDGNDFRAAKVIAQKIVTRLQ